jgi:hypothetical protein
MKDRKMSVRSSNTQSTNWLRQLLWGFLTFIFVGPQLTQAQVLPEKNETEPTDELQRLPSDRKVSQHLQELGRISRTGDEDEIRDALKLLRAAEPSLMVPDGSKLFRPLHRDLIERIQSFPEQLQTDLLNEPGATSRLLQNLYQDNGPSGLITFLHRYAGSRESFKAYLMLAAIHRDRGHRRATLYWLDPVLHATVPADLRESAIAMRDEVNAAANITTSAVGTDDRSATDDRSGDEESSLDGDGGSSVDGTSDQDVSDPEPEAAQEADDTATGAKPREAATDQNADEDATDYCTLQLRRQTKRRRIQRRFQRS